jgi:hypothetical protein
MLNQIGIGNEDQIGSRSPRFGDRTTPAPEHGGTGSGGPRSEVGMGETAERYWKELRPSSAGRFRLDVAIRHDREHPERHPRRRSRQHIRPKLRTTSR